VLARKMLSKLESLCTSKSCAYASICFGLPQLLYAKKLQATRMHLRYVRYTLRSICSRFIMTQKNRLSLSCYMLSHHGMLQACKQRNYQSHSTNAFSALQICAHLAGQTETKSKATNAGSSVSRLISYSEAAFHPILSILMQTLEPF
jgi:hypothetical protein